jgi:hypothetical protein
MAGADQPTGDGMYAAPEQAEETPTEAPRDPRTNARIAADLAAGAYFDPLDVHDEMTLRLLWGQEGRRLLAREDAVAETAAANGWGFTALDAKLSGHLVEVDITDSSPRVARNVCTPAEDGATVLDLTGVTFHRSGEEPKHLRLEIGTAGLVNFPSEHKLAVVPAGATDIGWRRFGDGINTESGEFDGKYRVHCQDPRWATLALNPALMQRLLDRWPVTLVVAANLFAVIKPGWVTAAELPAFKRLTEQLALSARAASSNRTASLAVVAAPTAHLSGWSAWPPQVEEQLGPGGSL